MSDPSPRRTILDLPPEIRNRVYTFTTYPTTGQRCCVVPCLALVRTCRQIYYEYRSMCLKADVVIDWKDVPRYFQTFFPTNERAFANIELAPARMTIFTDAFVQDDRPVEIDLLPILKFYLANEGFKCEFIRAEEIDCACVHNEGVSRDDLKTLLAADVVTLQKLLTHQHQGWTEDVTKGRIHKLMISHIGTNCCPQATFFIGPGEHSSPPSEFLNIGKNTKQAEAAAVVNLQELTAHHWRIMFSRNFENYMNRIKLRGAFLENQYSFLSEFQWSPAKDICEGSSRDGPCACGPGDDLDSGVSVV